MNYIDDLDFLRIVNKVDHPIFDETSKEDFYLKYNNDGLDLLVKFKSNLVYYSPLNGLISSGKYLDKDIYFKNIKRFFEALKTSVKNGHITEENRIQYVNILTNNVNNITTTERTLSPVLFDGLIDDPEYLKIIYHYGFNFNNNEKHIDKNGNITNGKNILHFIKEPMAGRIAIKYFGANPEYTPTHEEKTQIWTSEQKTPIHMRDLILPPNKYLSFIPKPPHEAAPIHHGSYGRGLLEKKKAIDMMDQLDKEKRSQALNTIASFGLHEWIMYRLYAPDTGTMFKKVKEKWTQSIGGRRINKLAKKKNKSRRKKKKTKKKRISRRNKSLH